MSFRLRNSADLCSCLGLRPNPTQRDAFERFEAGESPLDLQTQPDRKVIGGVGIAVLTHLLLVPGSQVLVAASETDLTGKLMGFLYDTTARIDRALASVCHWPAWDHLQISTDPGHRLKVMPNRPEWATKLAIGDTTLVLLGCSSRDVDFVDTRWRLEQHFKREDVRAIRVW